MELVDCDYLLQNMHEMGFIIIPNFLTEKDCNNLIQDYDVPQTYRKTVVREHYRFALGE